jgi:hypothetical protein
MTCVWEAFAQLGERCHEAGPLDAKTRRLVKLVLSVGEGLEGATHSAARNALASGITMPEACRGAGCSDPGLSCHYAGPHLA